MASSLRWFPIPLWPLLQQPSGSFLLSAQPASNAQYTIEPNVVWPGAFPVQGGPVNITFNVTTSGTPILSGSYTSLNAAYDACEANWGSPLLWFPEPLWLLLKDPQWSFILWCMASASVQYQIVPFVENYPGTTFPVQGGPVNIQWYALSIGAKQDFYGYYNSLLDAYNACQSHWNSQ